MSHVIHMGKVLHVRSRMAPTPTDISIRDYQDQDDEFAWLDLHADFMGHVSRGAARRWTRGDFYREFQAKKWWSPRHMWFAVSGPSAPSASRAATHEVLGTITLSTQSGSQLPTVHWLLVSQAHRRRGIGSLLLAHLEGRCRQLGHRELRLETLSDWSEAVAFYHFHGFKAIRPARGKS